MTRCSPPLPPSSPTPSPPTRQPSITSPLQNERYGIWVSKNAEFYADFKSVEMGEIKCFFERYGQKTMLNLAKFECSGFLVLISYIFCS
jgi:hypothetical protein